MMILGREKLEEFKAKHAEVRNKVDSWTAEVAAVTWTTPMDIKQRFASASFLKDNEVIFNIKGNQYRLHVLVNYANQIVLIKNVGTHDEYLKW